MKRSILGLFAAVTAGVAGVACGGVSGDTLFGGVGGGAPASSGSGSTSGGSTAGPTSSSSGQGGAEGASSGATSSSSSGATSSGATNGSSSGATNGATSGSSSSGGARPPVICDGATTACGAGQVCCFDQTPNTADFCGQPGTCGSGRIELSCSGPADCPGQVCCATGVYSTLQQEFQYSAIACKATCPYDNPVTEFPLCDGPSSTACGTGKQCIASNVLPAGYHVCN